MSTYGHIADCAVHYAGAQARYDGFDMTAVEAVLEARIALAACLVAAGWTPPADLAADLERDRTVLALRAGSLDRVLVAAHPASGRAPGNTAVPALPLQR